jgi:hypothetical protein
MLGEGKGEREGQGDMEVAGRIFASSQRPPGSMRVTLVHYSGVKGCMRRLWRNGASQRGRSGSCSWRYGPPQEQAFG